MTDTQAQEAARLASLLDAEQVRTVDVDVMHSQAAALLRSQAARIAELESRVHTCGPTCSKAGCINRRLTAERDALRAELARMREPLSAEALADKCESWLQLGGATNVVDAFEAGYRECEAHGITKTGGGV